MDVAEIRKTAATHSLALLLAAAQSPIMLTFSLSHCTGEWADVSVEGEKEADGRGGWLRERERDQSVELHAQTDCGAAK